MDVMTTMFLYSEYFVASGQVHKYLMGTVQQLHLHTFTNQTSVFLPADDLLLLLSLEQIVLSKLPKLFSQNLLFQRIKTYRGRFNA